MSESVFEGNPELGSHFPYTESNISATSTLPSSRSYSEWAASRPMLNLEFVVKGQTVNTIGKSCLFCRTPIRCPSGDQPLIEHMKSTTCMHIQGEIQTKILALGAESSAALAVVPTFGESSHAPHTSAETTHISSLACLGAEFEVPTSAWSNYPWHLHDPAHSESVRLPFFVCGINQAGDIIRLRSQRCTGRLPSPGLRSCDACAALYDLQRLKSLMQRMEDESPKNGLNYKFYCYRQMVDVVDVKNDKLKRLRLKGLDVRRDFQRLLGKTNDLRMLMSAISESDQIAVGRIVRVALRQGCSWPAIADRLKRAQQGTYHCQGYSVRIDTLSIELFLCSLAKNKEKTLDTGLLMLRLGGPRLLFAMSKLDDYPSTSTVNRRTKRAYLRPSIAKPTMAELLANVESICGYSRAVVPRPRGFSLLIDEIALEERARYSVAEDAVLGLCREHSGPFETFSMTGRPISHLYDLKQHLDSGRCHRAKEATVVAFAPFDESNYSPLIVLVSGTCKKGTVEEERSLICLCARAWNESACGRSAHGSLWSIATDGDPRRRQAIHSVCMSRLLSPASPIHKYLCHLELLNMMCGEGDITHDGDFKHEEKRLASALRSGDGVFVNGMHISPTVIKRYLRQLPGMTAGHLDSLFNNADRQDVPKSHALLKAICDASQLPDVRSQTVNQPFVLLAEFVNAFIAPHTTPSMSLSEQVTTLAKCAFLLFAIFRTDWSHFISTQLYYDIQASIKNAMFCIAKTKALDPTRCFYLIQTGDDRLENQFGIYRTLSGDRNLDLLQLAERAGSVQQITDVLGKYPEADRKPYRISLEGASGIDHLNPAGWVGDVCVGNVDLQRSWMEGRDAADKALRRAGIIALFDPGALKESFILGRNIDLMRPYGSYVGVTELDSCDEELDPDLVLLALDDPESWPVIPTTAPLSLAATYTSITRASRSSNAGSTHENAPVAAVVPSELAPDQLTDEELPLEYLLPPCMPAPENDIVSIPEEAEVKRGWVKIDSRDPVPLQTATRLILGTQSTEKSTDRLRRVCGFSRYPSIDTQSDSILGDLCLIDQIVLALVRVDKEVALAAVRVTEIQNGKSKVEAISMDHLNRADVTLTGQILMLDFDDGSWYWNKSYLMEPTGGPGKRSAKDAANKPSTKPLLVKFPASIIDLVNPPLLERNGQLVWSFRHTELLAAVDVLWSKASENCHKVPVLTCGASSGFPYESEQHGGQRLIHHDASAATQEMPAERCGPCKLCGHMVPIKDYMRTHVAKHILANRLKYKDDLVNELVAEIPCGFCGRAGTCRTTLTVRKTGTYLKSSTCPYYDKFSHKTAAITKDTSPCTNRPILCESSHCKGQDPVWSYNMRSHLLAVHGRSTYDHAVNTGLCTVSDEEIGYLMLDNMLVVPGKNLLTLRVKRPYEDSSIAGPTDDGATYGSSSKRVRFE
ncbi:hypothetical protein FRC09_006255 [Ceratobasidium sp. 395]|nr:hypothetical protein FRC09_006255 [Ceratobasidium sp. 395]